MNIAKALDRAVKSDPRMAGKWLPYYTDDEKEQLMREGACRTSDKIEVWSATCQSCANATLLYKGPADQYVDYVISRLSWYERADVCGEDYIVEA